MTLAGLGGRWRPHQEPRQAMELAMRDAAEQLLEGGASRRPLMATGQTATGVAGRVATLATGSTMLSLITVTDSDPRVRATYSSWALYLSGFRMMTWSYSSPLTSSGRATTRAAGLRPTTRVWFLVCWSASDTVQPSVAAVATDRAISFHASRQWMVTPGSLLRRSSAVRTALGVGAFRI